MVKYLLKSRCNIYYRRLLMKKNDFIQEFACRLTKIICEKGYGTSRSKAGVDIKQLAKISGCSYQMARKYALGQVLPDIPVIITIAQWLGTSPSMLLFGENDALTTKRNSDNTIEIDFVTLKYILNKSIPLLYLSSDSQNVINFIVDTVYDAAHLHVDTQTIFKIIDMMISSATLLQEPGKDNKDYGTIKFK